jgi:sucrose-6-phosphate hydrolase SacC (GH32 family)
VKVGATFRIYYAGQSPLGINLATSTDGVNWVQHPDNPIIAQETWPGLRSDYVNTPVVRRDGGLYRMWYRVAHADSGRIAIAHATSPDGVQWTHHGVVFDPDTSCGAVGPASVLKEQGGFHMFYWKTCFPQSAVRHATSGDGFTWQDEGVVIPPGFQGEIDSLATNGGWVDKQGGLYRMWYGGHDSSGEIRILAATSEDGAVWQPVPDVAIDAGAAAVIRVGNEYRLYGPYPKDGPDANRGFALWTWQITGAP